MQVLFVTIFYKYFKFATFFLQILLSVDYSMFMSWIPNTKLEKVCTFLCFHF
jgi:hypothetical protein